MAFSVACALSYSAATGSMEAKRPRLPRSTNFTPAGDLGEERIV
jgi:hypothetical protein